MTLATDYLGLDALLSAAELAWRDTVRAFVRDRIRPNITAWYESAVFPAEIVPEMGRLGLLARLFSSMESRLRRFSEQFGDVASQVDRVCVELDRNKVRRILLTSGKVYYELVARKNKDQRDDVAIVRIEQLAPLPKRRLSQTLDRYPNAEQYFWVQE